MEWESILLGFAMGLSSTIIAVRIQRSWQEFDDKRFIKKVCESLIVEIQNGLERTKNLIAMANEGKVSFGRIYVALWDSVNQRLAGSLKDGDVLNLLHQIYYRFDLINFNFEKNRPGVSGAFAKTYADEIENNLKQLKKRIGLKDILKDDGKTKARLKPDPIRSSDSGHYIIIHKDGNESGRIRPDFLNNDSYIIETDTED